MTMRRPTVLIFTCDPAFSREITAHWPQGGTPAEGPEFVVLEGGFSRHIAGDYELAIADASAVEGNRDGSETGSGGGPGQSSRRGKREEDVRQTLAAAGKPVIVVHSDPSRAFYNVQGTVIDLRRDSGLWPAIVGLLGREILRRRQAEWRAREAEKASTAFQAEATLGRYMLEMRTNVNNALTTVLGNAELLTHEPGLSANAVAQADAIRNMALRLHEVFQRFSSIEKELSVASRDTGEKATHAAAGRR